MAIQRITIDGYGQLELNQVAFRRDGRVEAQCKLNETDFTKAAPAENGMILAIDQVKREVKLPTASDGDGIIYALNYTSEHMYDDRANALKDFALVPGTFLPRLGYLAVGDKFTTNTVSAAIGAGASDEWATEAKVIEDLEKIGTAGGAPIYGILSADGSITITKSSTTFGNSNLLLNAVKYTTMPDGTPGIKFQVAAE